MKLLSNILLVSGLVLLFFTLYLVTLRYSDNRLNFEGYIQPQQTLESPTTPVAIVANSANIMLPIKSAAITDGKWEAPKSAAAHLATSPTPGETGNSIIYGHNWESIFGNLKDIELGDSVEVVLDNGESVFFIVNKILIVDPTDTFILDQTEESTLTIYTCTGFLDSKRLVLVANKQNSS